MAQIKPVKRPGQATHGHATEGGGAQAIPYVVDLTLEHSTHCIVVRWRSLGRPSIRVDGVRIGSAGRPFI